MSKINIFSNSSKGDFGYLSSEKKKAYSDHSHLVCRTAVDFFHRIIIFSYKTDDLDCRSRCRLSARM